MENENDNSWMVRLWRPMMGWTYMATCLFDFIIGPILYNVLQFYNPGQHLDMWHAITLQGGGLYHIAMGAIIGISSYGRTQEKINGADNTPSAPVQLPRPGPQPMAAPAPVARSPLAGPAPQVDEPL